MGYWYDVELGRYWLGQREYDPALKQFLQPDPSQQEGLASYAYAKSDPVDLADPAGTDACQAGSSGTCNCPAGMHAVGDDGGAVCTCPYNESEYEGHCEPSWTGPGNSLVYPDGSCWPDPSNCAGDAAYQADYNIEHTIEYTPIVVVIAAEEGGCDCASAGGGGGGGGGETADDAEQAALLDSEIQTEINIFRAANADLVDPTSGFCAECAWDLYDQLAESVYSSDATGLRPIQIVPTSQAPGERLMLNAATADEAGTNFWYNHAAVELPDGRVVDAMLYNPEMPIYASVQDWEEAFLLDPNPDLYIVDLLPPPPALGSEDNLYE